MVFDNYPEEEEETIFGDRIIGRSARRREDKRREGKHLVVPKACPWPVRENPWFGGHFASSTGQFPEEARTCDGSGGPKTRIKLQQRRSDDSHQCGALCTNAVAAERPTKSAVVSMLEGRAGVEQFVSEANVSIPEEKETRGVDVRGQSISMDVPWTASSTSTTADLYPIAMDTDYWEKRDLWSFNSFSSSQLCIFLHFFKERANVLVLICNKSWFSYYKSNRLYYDKLIYLWTVFDYFYLLLNF